MGSGQKNGTHPDPDQTGSELQLKLGQKWRRLPGPCAGPGQGPRAPWALCGCPVHSRGACRPGACPGAQPPGALAPRWPRWAPLAQITNNCSGENDSLKHYFSFFSGSKGGTFKFYCIFVHGAPPPMQPCTNCARHPVCLEFLACGH